MELTVCLAGNPNCGKTTLFNALTGSNQYVGNWPGVTVERKEADCEIGGVHAHIVDLPGAYSLSPYSIEERVTREYILSGQAGVVIDVIDAACIERSLYFTFQLAERGLKVVAAINMMDELERRGAHPDIPALSRALGVPVVPISARRREGLDALMTAVAAAAQSDEGSAAHIPDARPSSGTRTSIYSAKKNGAVHKQGFSGNETDGTRRLPGQSPDNAQIQVLSDNVAADARKQCFSVNTASDAHLGSDGYSDNMRKHDLSVNATAGMRGFSANAAADGHRGSDRNSDNVRKQGFSGNARRRGFSGNSATGAQARSSAGFVSRYDADTCDAVSRLAGINGGDVGAALDALSGDAPVPREGEAVIRAYAQKTGHDAFTSLAMARYRLISSALDACGFPRFSYSRTASDRMDRWLLGRALAFPILAAFVALMFMVTFGLPGEALRDLMEKVMSLASQGAQGLMSVTRAPAWASSLVVDGAVAGVGGVLTFLPQILLLFLCMSVMEDSGYMARAAFMTDRPLRAIGLSGRSFIPMLMGFGCTTTAVMAARGVENERDRRMTVMLTPFMSCGAKLPVYAVIVSAFFPGMRGAVVLCLYALGIVVMALCGALLRGTLFRRGESPFVMELPEYRLPTLRGVGCRMADRARDFMTRAGTIIFAMSVLIWFLRSFTPAFSQTADMAKSMLGALGNLLAPVFAPLGFGDSGRCVALLSGVVAKEAVVSTMQVVYSAGDLSALARILPEYFSPASAVSFLVFTLLYTPCVSAMAAMRRELGGGGWLAVSAGIQLAFAYIVSFLAYRLALLVL